MNAFTIKDLENLSGIKAHTIRIWEQRYSFLKPNRTDTNIRFYNNDELKTLLNVSLLNKYGFKISHIDKMSEQEMSHKIVGINDQYAQQEHIINTMIQGMINMDLDLFDSLLNDYIKMRGVEKTIHHLIFPFMEKIGVLWVTGHINPAQEHLVSNIIRQKLIVGTDMVSPMIVSNKVGVLFLPEGEFHEIGLLYVQYLLKSKGIKVYYLGSNVPLEDVAYLINHRKPDFVYSHLTSVSSAFSFEKFLAQAIKKIDHVPLIISGRLAGSYEKKIPPQIIFKKSIQEVSEFISSLG
jgi:methanogenic corrinoid protein MtbC1